VTGIAIVRAAHLHVYLDELREIGVPVERALRNSRLPSWIEETPDTYVSIPMSLEWIAGCGRDIKLMDLGFRAAQRATLASLSIPLRHALLDAPSGFARVRALLRLAALDNSALVPRMHLEGDHFRVVCDLQGLGGNPFVCLGEWLSLQALISIVRSVAGTRWCPAEMTFMACQRPTVAAQEAFPDTPILVGQPHTSILIGRDVLARPTTAGATEPSCVDDEAATWSFPAALRSAIRPYLADGYPDLSLMAEVVGLTGRTLQRRLQRCGRTYSDLVREERFDLTRELLADPSLVRAVAAELALTGPLTIGRIADRLGCSSRTLQRHLADQNSSLRAIVEESRLEIARVLLCKTELSVQEIADRSGYSTPSGFARAFSR
jgi:AraC-like DNA-binding protein